MVKFLREKFFRKLNNISFFHILFSSLITKVLGFILITFLTKFLTKYEMGILSYSQSILNFFRPFAGCGISYGLFVFLSRRNNLLEILLKKSFRYGNVCNALLIAFCTLFIILYPIPFPEAKWLLFGLFIAVIIQFHRDVFLTSLRALKRNDLFAYISGLIAFMVFFMVLLGSYLWKVKGYLLGYLCAQIGGLLLTILASKRILDNFRHKKTFFSEDRNLITLSISASFTNMLSLVLYNIDVFLIGSLLKDPQKVAEYYVATLIPFNLIFLPLSVMTSISPYIASNYSNSNWLRSSIKKVILGIGSINLIITLIIIIFSKEIIILFFGEKYINSVKILNILMLSFLLGGTFRIVLGNTLASIGLVRYNLINSISCGFLNLILSYFLIEKFGTIGAAYGTLCIMAISSILGYVFLRNYLRRIECY